MMDSFYRLVIDAHFVETLTVGIAVVAGLIVFSYRRRKRWPCRKPTSSRP
jgi:hypothetical protein